MRNGKPTNPKGTTYYSTPRAQRKRKGVEVMLNDEERALLDGLVETLRRPKARIVAAALRLFARASEGAQTKLILESVASDATD